MGLAQLERMCIARSAYRETRMNGQKHLEAIDAAVAEVRQRVPWMRISRTGVKRLLAQTRGKKSQFELRIEKSIVAESDPIHYVRICMELWAIASGDPHLVAVRRHLQLPLRTKYTLGLADREEYPRTNATDS